MKITTNIFIEKARYIHGDRYDYSRVVYKNMKAKVEIVCLEHGVFEQTPDKHLHGRCGCPLCAGNQRFSVSDFVNKARRIHGDKYDYSKVVYENNRIPVEIVCLEHGSFMQSPSNHLSGKGCPYCAGNVKSSNAEFIRKAKLVHGDTYDYSDIHYEGNRYPVTIRCSEHGVFEQLPYVHLNGSGCPVCAANNRVLHRDAKLAYDKSVKTFLRNYGVSNPMYDEKIRRKHKQIVGSSEINEKRIATKRRNGSFNTSLGEDKVGEWLRFVFGDDDVFSNYVSDVYPFKCDYYVKSRDMYIELNFHWSHGHHWYDELLDRETVNDWLLKSKAYQNAANTFSVRDVQKRNIACKNRLNYVVLWNNDLSDVKIWFELGCPDGRDWDREYSWL